MEILVEQYSKEKLQEWNEFAAKARNSHFFFQRGYMDYHADRFQDFSLMIYNAKRNLIALLPNAITKTLIGGGKITFWYRTVA